MRRYRSHIALVASWFLTANMYQTALFVGRSGLHSKKMWLYMAVHVALIAWCGMILRAEWKKPNGLFHRMAQAYRELPIPRVPKTIFLAILVIEVLHISEGRIRYPFDDVGMFRYARKAQPLPTVLTLPKYFYHDAEGKVVPLEIRKQHLFFPADLLGVTYNNEFTFSAAYHYKGEKANHDFLLHELHRHAGIDTLWVGLQSVDYSTGAVSFDPDLGRACQFNDTATIFYGPIYVPEYQRTLVNCSAHIH